MRSRSRSSSFSPERSAQTPRFVVRVEGLSRNVTKAHVEEIFGQVAEITQVAFPVNEATGYGRGYALLEYAQADDVKQAIRFMHGGQLDGNIIECVESSGTALDRELRPSIRTEYVKPSTRDMRRAYDERDRHRHAPTHRGPVRSREYHSPERHDRNRRGSSDSRYGDYRGGDRRYR